MSLVPVIKIGGVEYNLLLRRSSREKDVSSEAEYEIMALTETQPVNNDDGKNRNDWLRTAYAEAWKQYSHEDTLSMQRNNLFIIIQTALLATLASLITALLRIENIGVGSHSVYVSYISIGALLVIFSVFSLALLNNWKRVTESARAYVNLRWSTCRRIEAEVNLESEGLSLAAKEKDLQDAIGRRAVSYSPYANSGGLEDFAITNLGALGWDSTKSLINLLTALWSGLLLGGVVAIAIATILTMKSTPPAATQTIQINGPATIKVPAATVVTNSNSSPRLESSPAPSNANNSRQQ